jgi:hypothetical protein
MDPPDQLNGKIGKLLNGKNKNQINPVNPV